MSKYKKGSNAASSTHVRNFPQRRVLDEEDGVLDRRGVYAVVRRTGKLIVDYLLHLYPLRQEKEGKG